MMKRAALLLLDIRLRARSDEDADTVAKYCIKYGIAGEGFEKIVSFILGLKKFEQKERIISLTRTACLLRTDWEKLVTILLDERLYQYNLLTARYELMQAVVTLADKQRARSIFEQVKERSERIEYPRNELLYTPALNRAYMEIIEKQLVSA